MGEEAVAVEVVVLPWGEEVEEERRLYLRHLGFLGKSKRFELDYKLTHRKSSIQVSETLRDCKDMNY